MGPRACLKTNISVGFEVLTAVGIVLLLGYTVVYSIVGIATRYGLDGQGVGVRIPVGSKIVFAASRPALGPSQPPVHWVPGGDKAAGREADDSPPTNAEVKKTWIYTSTPPYVFYFYSIEKSADVLEEQSPQFSAQKRRPSKKSARSR
jgi:hypothetical protein